MISVRKRGKVYEYRIEIASINGVRKWLTKSGFKTRQEALHEGAIAYNEYYQCGKKQKQKDMSYADYLDYWIDNYCNFNLKYSTIVTYLNIIKLYLKQILHATVHMDEKTPHIHCVVIPLVKKFDKRTNSERYTISKKQYIRDKEHLSELQDKYHQRLRDNGYDLERGLKGSNVENLSVKEYKKITSNLEKELTKKENNLEKSINNLEEQLKSNKPIMFDKESVKVKKETLECMNQVIKDAKKIEEMQPKITNTFNSMKKFSDTLSETHKENKTLNNELSNLHLRNKKLENQIEGLTETIDYLESIIKAIIEFIYKLFRNFNIPKCEEKEFRKEFYEHIPSKLYKEKNKDDFEL